MFPAGLQAHGRAHARAEKKYEREGMTERNHYVPLSLLCCWGKDRTVWREGMKRAWEKGKEIYYFSVFLCFSLPEFALNSKKLN